MGLHGAAWGGMRLHDIAWACMGFCKGTFVSCCTLNWFSLHLSYRPQMFSGHSTVSNQPPATHRELLMKFGLLLKLALCHILGSLQCEQHSTALIGSIPFTMRKAWQ